MNNIQSPPFDFNSKGRPFAVLRETNGVFREPSKAITASLIRAK
jgi:hypothetical protein